MSWATSNSTAAAPSCCSRYSPNARNAPRSRSRRTPRSPNGPAPSPTPDSAPRSWTGSPSKPTSSRPAPSPTGYAPPNADTPNLPPPETGKGAPHDRHQRRRRHGRQRQRLRPGHRPRQRRIPAPPRRTGHRAGRAGHRARPTGSVPPPQGQSVPPPRRAGRTHPHRRLQPADPADGRHRTRRRRPRPNPTPAATTGANSEENSPPSAHNEWGRITGEPRGQFWLTQPMRPSPAGDQLRAGSREPGGASADAGLLVPPAGRCGVRGGGEDGIDVGVVGRLGEFEPEQPRLRGARRRLCG